MKECQVQLNLGQTIVFFVNLRFSDNSVPLKTTGVSPLEWFVFHSTKVNHRCSLAAISPSLISCQINLCVDFELSHKKLT